MKENRIDSQQYRRYYQVITDIQKRPNTRAYATVAFTFLTISLFAWYAVRPTLQTILYLRREIQDKTEVNKKMDEKIAALIEAQSSYREIEPNLIVLSQALPESPNVVGLLGQISSLAAITQASISAVAASDVPIDGLPASQSADLKTTSAEEIPITITVIGSFGQLQLFLQGLIDMLRIVTIDSVDFTPNILRQEPSGGSLQMSIKARTHFAPEETDEK